MMITPHLLTPITLGRAHFLLFLSLYEGSLKSASRVIFLRLIFVIIVKYQILMNPLLFFPFQMSLQQTLHELLLRALNNAHIVILLCPKHNPQNALSFHAPQKSPETLQKSPVDLLTLPQYDGLTHKRSACA